jgi:hypothetical protein
MRPGPSVAVVLSSIARILSLDCGNVTYRCFTFAICTVVACPAFAVGNSSDGSYSGLTTVIYGTIPVCGTGTQLPLRSKMEKSSICSTDFH